MSAFGTEWTDSLSRKSTVSEQRTFKEDDCKIIQEKAKAERFVHYTENVHARRF